MTPSKSVQTRLPSKKYVNPPIKEALCDFQFEFGRPWDWTIPGLFYEKVKDDYPNRQEARSLGFELRAHQGGLAQSVSENVRLQFRSKAEPFLIQVGPTGLTVNHIQPYSDWETFQPKIAKAFADFSNLCPIKSVRRIGLRYINQVDFDEPGVDYRNYFKLATNLPKELPHGPESFLFRLEIPYEHIGAILYLTLATVAPSKQGGSSFILDIDFATPPDNSIEEPKAVFGWIEAAHAQVDQVFESCIEDVTRARFGGLRK